MKKRNDKIPDHRCLLAVFALVLLTGAASMVDPTRPPANLIPAGKSVTSSGGPQLRATFISPTQSYALISGQTVHVGDAIDSYTIINIMHDTVELRGSQNESVVLHLFPTVKQISNVTKGR